MMADTAEPAKEEAKEEASFSIVNALSFIIVLGQMAAMPLWMFYPPKGTPEILAIINNMQGAWGMAFATVVAYHLGSSKGSKEAQQSTRDTVTTLSASVAKTVDTAAKTADTAATVAAAAVNTGATNGAAETAAWKAADEANTRTSVQGYLDKFPTGVNAPEARARLAAAGV